jgi:trehalose/maltose hydrolase-like predicted phosphorylase
VSSGILPTASNTIYSAVSPNGISNITAYVVSRLTFPDVSLSTKPWPSCFAGVKKNVSIASQCYFTEPSEKGTITVIKYVGIASSDAFPGRELETAHAAVTQAATDGYSAVLAEHDAAWSALWDDADIIIPGETPVIKSLQLSARASLFHLLSNLRPGSEPRG